MPPSTTSVVPIGAKVCKPFLLEVMVFSPEAGFKFKVTIERSCTPDADEIWKLVFDLFRVKGDKETQLVHVSFTAGTPVQSQAVQKMRTAGVNPAQADALVKKVHPAVKAIAGVAKPTQAQKDAIHDAMVSVAV